MEPRPEKTGAEAGGSGRKPLFKTVTILTAILIVGLVIRLLHYWAISQTAFPRIPFVFTDSDMYAFWQWAHTILAGDFLGRDAYHPYFEWMKEIAPLEIWYRWWGGKEIFQEAPLYPYWAAGLLAVSGNSMNFVLLVQLLLGALQPLIMFFLGKRLFDERSGLVAAALTAFYGPFIFHQGTLLRDWLPPMLEPLALLLLLRAREKGRAEGWILAGAALGLSVLVKETALLFLFLVGLWLLWEVRGALRHALRPAGLVLTGLLLSLSPLLVRNVLVGAPILSLSNRSAEGFIEGNAADGYPIGLRWPGSMKRILEGTDGHLGSVIRETFKTYNGNWLMIVKLYLLKLRAIVDPLEVPNNANFYYGLEISPVLRFTLGWGIILPLGLAGLLVSLASWRRHMLPLLYGISMLAGLMVAPVMGRYRLTLVPALVLYAAAGLAWFGKALHGRERSHGIAFAGLIAALAVAQNFLVPVRAVRENPAISALYDGVEYIQSAKVYAADGQFERAMSELERLKTKAEAEHNSNFAGLIVRASFLKGVFYAFWAERLLRDGKQDEAKRRLNEAETAFSSDLYLPTPNYYLGSLHFKLSDPEKAKVYLRRFLALEPDGPRAGVARSLLAKLDASR